METGKGNSRLVETTFFLITEKKLGFRAFGKNNSNTKESKNKYQRVFFVSFLKSTLLLRWYCYYSSLWRTFSVNSNGFVMCGDRGRGAVWLIILSLTHGLILCSFHNFAFWGWKEPLEKCSPAVNIYSSVCLASIGVFQKPLYFPYGVNFSHWHQSSWDCKSFISSTLEVPGVPGNTIGTSHRAFSPAQYSQCIG